ncbi:hypothetical protein B296_00004678 [Ensete ventricosum]|uniref:Uncharacterized protein n=1 Tax=Ensete ventricosum TaxID=4639 RepID=A0A426Z0S8_ENSVE|nr:hypothetical protein B296_00004678 [Ensete ventricosum]
MACSGRCASNTEQRLPYWNIFTPSAALKSNPTADTTAASPRTSAASPRPLPFGFLPNSFNKAQRTYSLCSIIVAKTNCYLSFGDDLKLSGDVLKLPYSFPFPRVLVSFAVTVTDFC